MNENQNQNNQNNHSNNNNNNQAPRNKNYRGAKRPRNQYGETIQTEKNPARDQEVRTQANAPAGQNQPRNQQPRPQGDGRTQQNQPRNQQPRAQADAPTRSNQPRNQQPRPQGDAPTRQDQPRRQQPRPQGEGRAQQNQPKNQQSRAQGDASSRGNEPSNQQARSQGENRAQQNQPRNQQPRPQGDSANRQNQPRNQQPRAQEQEQKDGKLQSVVRKAIRPRRQKPNNPNANKPVDTREANQPSRNQAKPVNTPETQSRPVPSPGRNKPAVPGQATRRSDSNRRPEQRNAGRPRQGTWNRPRPEPQINFTQTNTNDKDIVRIMPLGGIEEIGKNMTAVEYRDEIIVIDCGLKFPEDEMLGIDSVIPDTSFLEHNMHKIKGFFITHGHEDHIGALPHILKKINVPVYSTKLTLGLIENKLREHNIANKVKLITVKPRDVIRFDHVSVEFIKTNHSIADASALAIHTGAGVLVHTGDFKVDLTPVAGDTIDLARFASLGEEGVLALMSDSTNAERPGYTESESTVGENFDKLFAKAKGRILVATFSSNIDRIQQVVGSARKTGRKVVINGRSMENNVNVARELGYLEIEEENIVPVNDMRRYRDDQLVIMTTGSQGEPMAALSRMALGEHRQIRIQPDDTVIFSSHPIPGNEKGIFKTIDLLYKLGADVIYDSKEDVHVSGHACQEELKLIMALTKPKYFVPVHGEFRMLKTHAELAIQMGLQSKDILIPELGDIIELSQEKVRKNGKVQFGSVLVDGLGVGDVGSVVLRDRKLLSEDGMVTIVITVDSESGSVIAGPDLISRGFIFVKEADSLMEDARRIVKKILIGAEGTKLKDTEFIQNQIREQLRNFFYRKTKRRPMIMPIIMDI